MSYKEQILNTVMEISGKLHKTLGKSLITILFCPILYKINMKCFEVLFLMRQEILEKINPEAAKLFDGTISSKKETAIQHMVRLNTVCNRIEKQQPAIGGDGA